MTLTDYVTSVFEADTDELKDFYSRTQSATFNLLKFFIMLYRNINNAIQFAIDEVRHAKYELNNDEEFIDLEAFKMLFKVQEKLQEALDNLW